MILKNGNSYKFYYQCTKKLSSHSLSPPYWLGLVLPQLLRGLSCSDASALSPDMHCIQYVQNRILNLCISAIRLPSCRASYTVCAVMHFKSLLFTDASALSPEMHCIRVCAAMHFKSLHFTDASVLSPEMHCIQHVQ